MIAGIFNLAAAISIPGTISTRASRPCAIVIDSIESAISSRLAREYFIPLCPIAIPSQTPIAGNSNGVPPAILTPVFTASAILSR